MATETKLKANRRKLFGKTVGIKLSLPLRAQGLTCKNREEHTYDFCITNSDPTMYWDLMQCCTMQNSVIILAKNN